MRTTTTATGTAAGKPATSPLWFMELNWIAVVTRVCSYDTLDWNGNSWAGAGITVGTLDARGVPTQIVFADPDFTYRTLMLANGIRDRALRLWSGFADALADDDPVEVFNGVVDSGDWANGRLTIVPSRSASGSTFTPRERVGPAIGINFTGTPGEVVRWAGQSFVLETQ